MSVVLHQNQKHRQMDENPEGKRVVFTVLVTAVIVFLIGSIYSASLKRIANADKVAISVESGIDYAAQRVVAEAHQDPAINNVSLNKDGTLTLNVDSALNNKQFVAVEYKRLARVQHATTIKSVMVQSPDGDRSAPEYP